MYRKLEESSGNVLGYEARGKLNKEELGAILANGGARTRPARTLRPVDRESLG